MHKLNLGCGPVQPEGWEIVDGSWRAWSASHLSWFDRLMTRLKLWPLTEFTRKTRFANLLKPLPWQTGSVDCIYLGEVLEHFTRQDGMRLLHDCFRILKPGGTIRVRVPDNARFWRNYLNQFDEAYRKPRQEWTESHSVWVEMFFRDICVRRSFRGSFGHFHKWMYDEISLTKTLEKVGFASVERRSFLDSSITDIKSVETHEDLTIEATKPLGPLRPNKGCAPAT
jgi:predicted SAM-dependent methyltransferase